MFRNIIVILSVFFVILRGYSLFRREYMTFLFFILNSFGLENFFFRTRARGAVRSRLSSPSGSTVLYLIDDFCLAFLLFRSRLVYSFAKGGLEMMLLTIFA
jgi:cellulose synthase/poly-beta-1,6-N-acetylglucosamine synthase-like glycosyltransferase